MNAHQRRVAKRKLKRAISDFRFTKGLAWYSPTGRMAWADPVKPMPHYQTRAIDVTAQHGRFSLTIPLHFG